MIKHKTIYFIRILRIWFIKSRIHYNSRGSHARFISVLKIRGVVSKKFFWALRASFGLKIRGAGSPGPLSWIRYCGSDVNGTSKAKFRLVRPGGGGSLPRSGGKKCYRGLPPCLSQAPSRFSRLFLLNDCTIVLEPRTGYTEPNFK